MFRMSLVMVVRRMLCSISTEQYMLPEDDLVIETCWSVLNVLM